MLAACLGLWLKYHGLCLAVGFDKNGIFLKHPMICIAVNLVVVAVIDKPKFLKFFINIIEKRLSLVELFETGFHNQNLCLAHLSSSLSLVFAPSVIFTISQNARATFGVRFFSANIC